MNSHLTEIRRILIEIGETLEGNLICDIHPDNLVIERNQAKIKNLQTLAKEKTNICEIGVNAGHSLLLMLEVNPTANYVLFDIGSHKYTRPCVDYIRSVYPDTSIQILYGDSKETMPRYEGSFDLIHVDGGHELPELTSDYRESTRLIRKGCPIVFDDYDFPVIRTFLKNKLESREIIPIEDSTLIPTEQHIIVTNPN